MSEGTPIMSQEAWDRTRRRHWFGRFACGRCGFVWIVGEDLPDDRDEPFPNRLCPRCGDMTADPSYPDLTRPFPKEIALCGVPYRIAEHEGAIVFSAETFTLGIPNTRLTVERKAGCWYVEVVEGGAVMAGHIEKAMKIVHEYRGLDHEDPKRVRGLLPAD